MPFLRYQVRKITTASAQAANSQIVNGYLANLPTCSRYTIGETRKKRLVPRSELGGEIQHGTKPGKSYPPKAIRTDI